MRTSALIADVGLRGCVLHDLASAERLLPEWRDLWSRCPHATTFQHPEWLLAWMQSFEPSHPLLIEVRCNDRIVGLATENQRTAQRQPLEDPLLPGDAPGDAAVAADRAVARHRGD